VGIVSKIKFKEAFVSMIIAKKPSIEISSNVVMKVSKMEAFTVRGYAENLVKTKEIGCY
jgi:hypothetical protein